MGGNGRDPEKVDETWQCTIRMMENRNGIEVAVMVVDVDRRAVSIVPSDATPHMLALVSHFRRFASSIDAHPRLTLSHSWGPLGSQQLDLGPLDGNQTGKPIIGRISFCHHFPKDHRITQAASRRLRGKTCSQRALIYDSRNNSAC